ncbi:DUF2933 domain-containing protein [Streptomyces sp. NPDC050636]|uniref:DUF2933 domain-containing protein n=1 Tax=Streptomyces sp. NPDC050636 TaxID=3154510 RepID=UPI003444EB95
MRSKTNYGLYALAVALVGALVLGLPVGSLIILAVVVACPLMMFLMMRGMTGGHGDEDQHTDRSDALRKPGSDHDHIGSGRP